jgi:4-amino-4-deoxy-L-arabinose transferase-like glycosyltransferase
MRQDYTQRIGLVFSLILICYLMGLHGMSVPLTGDQKVYLSIALEMKERGSWVIPYLYDAPNFLKPPFQYWATLMGWSLGGLSIFWSMVPSVLAVIGSAWMIYKIAPATQSLAALFFVSTFGTMTYGTTAQMEIWIVFFYLWAWREWLQDRPWFALSVVGVMAWIKGPLYPVLWVLSAYGERIYSRRRISLQEGVAVLWGAGLGLSWYVLAAQSEWPAMRAVFFEQENLGKLHTTQGSPGGLWSSFVFSLLPILPAILYSFAFPSILNAIRGQRRFLLFYGLLPAVFFTFFPYRVNTYLYLLTPVVMILSSMVLVPGSSSEALPETTRQRRVRWLLMGALIIAATLLCAVGVRMAQGQWVGWELVAPLGINLVLWAWAFFKRRWFVFGVAALLLVSLVRVAGVQMGERDLAGLRIYLKEESSPQLAYWIEEKDIWHEFGLVSAAIGQGIKRVDRSGVSQFLQQGGAVILDENQKSSLELNLNCRPWPRLKRRMKFPFDRLLLEGLHSNDPDVLRMFFVCKARH